MSEDTFFRLLQPAPENADQHAIREPEPFAVKKARFTAGVFKQKMQIGPWKKAKFKQAAVFDG